MNACIYIDGHQSDLCTAIYYKTYCVCMVLIACHMHMLRILDQFIKTAYASLNFTKSFIKMYNIIALIIHTVFIQQEKDAMIKIETKPSI